MTTLTTPKPSRAEFEEVLASMAVVDRLKTRDEILAREADLPSRKADIAVRLRETYERQQVAVSDAQILAGVDAYFEGRLVFKEPRRSPGLAVSYLWTERVRLARKLAKGTAITAAALVAVYLVFVLPVQVYRNSVVSETTRKVALAATRLHQAEKSADETFNQSSVETVAASKEGQVELTAASAKALAEIRRHKAEADRDLRAAEGTLASYLPPEEKIDYAHTEDASRRVNEFYNALAAVEKPVTSISGVAAKMRDFEREDAALLAAWKSFDLATPPAGVKSRGQEIYQRTVDTIALFQEPGTARKGRIELEELTNRSLKLSRFPEAIRAAAARVRTLAKEPDAAALADRAETEGLAAAATADLTTAQTQLDNLEQVAGQLMQNYTLRIVNRPGEYTRFWRYSGRNIAVKNYYVVVEPVDGNGHVVPQSIRSEEDGATRRVSKWAERVDSVTYDKVGEDKKDDGILQNDTFAKKETGRLNPSYLMGPKASGGEPAAGRIFRWEYKR